MKTPSEHLEKFIELLKTDKALMSEAKKFLTITQQKESEFVGGPMVETGINGFYHAIKASKDIKVKAIPTSNKVIVDCIISYEDTDRKKKQKIQCRLVKESGIRKADVLGEWGINSNSFKFIN